MITKDQLVFSQIAEEVATVINKSQLFQELLDNNKFLVRQAEQLKEVANCDALTGGLNRGAFMVTLARQIRASAAVGKTLGVIMADIDHLKEVNDTNGHAAGDLALREFTHRLSSALRQNDYLGRYGGEEFLILIDDTNADALPKIAERFRSIITASLGLAVVTDAAKSAQAVVAVADGALYAAKGGGRNRCVLAG
ncbi:MAG: GGDEF domain-containing protein [Gammaproteobacteria bacterium]